MPRQPSKLIEKAKSKFNFKTCLAFKFCSSGQSYSNDSVCYDYDTIRRAQRTGAAIATSTRIEHSVRITTEPPNRTFNPSDYFYHEYHDEADGEMDETLQLTNGMRKQRAKVSIKKRFSLSRGGHYANMTRGILYESSQLEMEQSSFDISKFPLLMTTPDKTRNHKLTSTAIGGETTIESSSFSSSSSSLSISNGSSGSGGDSVGKWPPSTANKPVKSSVLTEETTFNEYEDSEQDDDSSNAFSNHLYNSPVLARKKTTHLSNSTTPSSCFTNSSATSSTSPHQTNDDSNDYMSNNSTGSFSDKYADSFGFHTKDFQTATSRLFDSEQAAAESEKAVSVTGQGCRPRERVTQRSPTTSKEYHSATPIYICCISYEAKSPTELSIEFTDRLKLVQQLENWDYCLVQNVVTEKYGYVPKYCVSELNTFLKDVKYLRKKA